MRALSASLHCASSASSSRAASASLSACSRTASACCDATWRASTQMAVAPRTTSRSLRRDASSRSRRPHTCRARVGRGGACGHAARRMQRSGSAGAPWPRGYLLEDLLVLVEPFNLLPQRVVARQRLAKALLRLRSSATILAKQKGQSSALLTQHVCAARGPPVAAIAGATALTSSSRFSSCRRARAACLADSDAACGPPLIRCPSCSCGKAGPAASDRQGAQRATAEQAQHKACTVCTFACVTSNSCCMASSCLRSTSTCSSATGGDAADVGRPSRLLVLWGQTWAHRCTTRSPFSRTSLPAQ